MEIISIWKILVTVKAVINKLYTNWSAGGSCRSIKFLILKTWKPYSHQGEESSVDFYHYDINQHDKLAWIRVCSQLRFIAYGQYQRVYCCGCPPPPHLHPHPCYSCDPCFSSKIWIHTNLPSRKGFNFLRTSPRFIFFTFS